MHEAADEGIYSAYSRLSMIYGEGGEMHDEDAVFRWYAKHVEATDDCGWFPKYDRMNVLHLDSPVFGSPSATARCVLRALRRYHDEVIFWDRDDLKKIARPTRIEMQKILRDEGFYQGSIDGVFGSGTFSAMNAWAASK